MDSTDLVQVKEAFLTHSPTALPLTRSKGICESRSTDAHNQGLASAGLG